MRLATREDGNPDGRLIVVNSTGDAFVDAPVPTMQEALETWSASAAALAAIQVFPSPIDQARLRAPLPRAWQWLDGSAFSSHGDLMQKVLGLDPIEADRPLMYQGVSDRFYGPKDDVRFASEDLGIDFEGEFGVIVDEVPMGTSASAAMDHIKLLIQINDWSLRTLAGPEMKTGFGWVQAKPPCSMAPFAITPEEIGPSWNDGRVCLDLCIRWNDNQFGQANGRPMDYGFHELVAHAARTRDLVAGTVIGSGTVSNANFREVGSSCIAERRGIEIVDEGTARTQFMRFGDTVTMEARDLEGRTPFGKIEQQVVQA